MPEVVEYQGHGGTTRQLALRLPRVEYGGVMGHGQGVADGGTLCQAPEIDIWGGRSPISQATA